MKKLFLLSALMATFGLSMAQEVQTYSVYDANQSGTISVEDVTATVEQVKNDVAATSTQQYVTASDLSELFKNILSDLKLIKEKLGIEGPSQQLASFEVPKKTMKVGDTFTQDVTTSSDGTVTFLSSNTSVASVDASGVVTAVAIGEAIITAVIAATQSNNALSASYTVVVEAGNIMNGHEYVDLGLPSGTLWAKTNIGAENQYDYGNYFAWGETSGYKDGKSSFTWNTYKYYETKTETDAEGFDVDKSGVTKYATSSKPGCDGFYDGKTTLDPEDDAAHVNWGGSWRMPTQSELNELLVNCTWTRKSLNGVDGYKVTSKTNSNYIFLPFVGEYSYSSLRGGSFGTYWISSLSGVRSTWALCLHIESNEVGLSSGDRYHGYSVRPVCTSSE